VFHKILIANRGEIAVRIIRTCHRMGIGAVAVYSDVDIRSPYIEASDEAVYIGPAPTPESYLSKEKIISAALSTGCQAVHPGYGFLSENAEFARMVVQAGLVFIGPCAEAIATLGDKIASKDWAIKIGASVVPGHNQPLSGTEEATAKAEQIGFPVLLKPAAGGGGRGMRIVEKKEDLGQALDACRAETRKGFADDRIFMERYIVRPRHIEIQILADHHGNVIHLGERECSIQRRYQKVIEESPSPAVDESLRQKMGIVACTLAKEVGYTNAGTVEFVLDADKKFYFLEMNTRLQVEHPVTEMVTSLDLVELQLRISAGERLPITQRDVEIKGWAIEARVCAEDPHRGYFPTTGMITRYAEPRGKHIRVDSGVGPGSVVTIYYDSLLAKVIAHGDTRESARQMLGEGLNGYHIEGLATNVDFANAIVDLPAFAQGDLSTDFIEKHFVDGRSKLPPSREKLHYMAIAAVLIHHIRQNLVWDSLKPMAATVGGEPFRRKSVSYVLKAEEDVFDVHLEGDQSSHRWNISIDSSRYRVITPEFEFYRRRLRLTIDDYSHMFRARYQESHIQIFFCGIIRTFEIYTPFEWELSRHMPRRQEIVQENVVRCPMPGLVTVVRVNKGQTVRKGEELMRIESMKMESGIASQFDGEVEKVMVKSGNTVETDEILLTFKTRSEETIES
jgi:propionyl-CoA carboxylase alpha chain